MVIQNQIEPGVQESKVQEVFTRHCKHWVFQEERGGQLNGLHYQCYMSLHNKMTKKDVLALFGGLTLADGTPIKPAAISAQPAQVDSNLIKYCQKEGRIRGPWASKVLPMEVELIDEWREELAPDWQKAVLQLYGTVPNKRAIYWFWDHVGNSGKSVLAKHLKLVDPSILVATPMKASDLFHVLARRVEAKVVPKFIIVDLPRGTELTGELYRALEQTKNGLLTSGKYESTELVFNTPQIVVFANEPPDRTKWSADRYSVHEITTEATH